MWLETGLEALPYMQVGGDIRDSRLLPPPHAEAYSRSSISAKQTPLPQNTEVKRLRMGESCDD